MFAAGHGHVIYACNALCTAVTFHVIDSTLLAKVGDSLHITMFLNLWQLGHSSRTLSAVMQLRF